MTTISSKNISDYCSKDPITGWPIYEVNDIKNEKICQFIANKCTSEARYERLKYVAKYTMAIGTSLFLAAIAYAVGKVSALVIGIALTPLASIPPLYILTIALGGIGSGITFGYYTISKIWNNLTREAKENWELANHLYAQAEKAEFHIAQLN